jgi:hypothetical protein
LADQYGELGNGEIVNLGHNQHVSGLRIHHPKVGIFFCRCHVQAHECLVNIDVACITQQTYEEVAALVRSVRDRGGKLRAVGAAHSWNTFYPDNNTDAVFLDQFKGIWQDPQDYTRVTVQGTKYPLIRRMNAQRASSLLPPTYPQYTNSRRALR